ncbi:thiolase-like protein [Aspergillus venezuelensis]
MTNCNPDDPIVIAGMALRLPGDVNDPATLWRILMGQRDSRCRVPEDRYNIDATDTSSADGNLKHFDPSSFSMTRAEIERLDPQARILLELTREALERAGETNWRGKNIGCYISVHGNDWEHIQLMNPLDTSAYSIKGYSGFMLCNHISYEYDFKGPSLTTKNYCSSPLIALHLACQASKQNDCRSAIVGGTNLILSPSSSVAMSAQGVPGPDGKCKTFDAAADEYSRADGINVLYIKRLSDAVADGNPICAVIRSTVSNADGKTAGLSRPSYLSHDKLIRMAHTTAGITDVAETAFVKCHGTGTPIGDPLETRAIANVYGDNGVYIGSCKPNLGHSEGALGISGVMKVVLALQHETIPPNINFHKPNPKDVTQNIYQETEYLIVPTEPVAWPQGRAKRALVNSFGVGGANGAALIESASCLSVGYQGAHQRRDGTSARPRLLLFSASNSASVQMSAAKMSKYLTNNPSDIQNVEYTLAVHREHLPFRSFAVTDGSESATISPSPTTTKAKLSRSLCFVFTGQGAHWVGMAKELLNDFPSFRQDLQFMDEHLQKLEDPPCWSLLQQLSAPKGHSIMCKTCSSSHEPRNAGRADEAGRSEYLEAKTP